LEKNINVTIKFYGHSSQRGGELIEEVEVSPGTTVKAVIDIFSRNHPNTCTAQSMSATPANREQTYAVMVNGISVGKSKQSTLTVQGGDQITIFLPISGG